MAYLYLYNGEYRTYAYLHDNYGYNLTPTQPVTYHSVDSWAQEGGSGYFDGNEELVPVSGMFFKTGTTGWMDANDLAIIGRAYPSYANDDVTCIQTGTHLVSDAAIITCGEHDYYLIKEALNYGWVRDDHLADIGWGIDPGGIFFEVLQPVLNTFKKQTVFTEIQQPTLEKIIVSVPCSLYVIDEDGIIGIGGITYAYGYEFHGRKRVIEQSDVWVTQYQCVELWVGWETKTDAQLEAMGLSLADPNHIIIGQTTSVESGITTLSSDYYWVYTFSSTSTTNWYHSNNYAANPSPITTGSQETVSSSGTYVEAELSDGDGNAYSPETFRIDTYSDSPEIYFSPEVSAIDSGKCGCIVKFNPTQYSTPFNLPSGLYTISGTTLTWNTSHPMYILLEGKEAFGS